MVARILRYPDLEEAGIVSNRVTLYRWIKDHGFPPGFLLGPNSRGWLEREVDQWLSIRGACRDVMSGSRTNG
jgi:predicted DNA-binding transcriptional regulator AlpA